MIRNGIDCIDKYAHLFQGKRIGLITAPTGLTKDFVSTIQILHEKFNLAALFSPEHGVRGDQPRGPGRDVCGPVYAGARVQLVPQRFQALEPGDAG